MKLITALYLVLLIAIVTGCGPHFMGKPETYRQEAAVKTSPQTVKINLPNWPIYAYHHKEPDVYIIMAIRDIDIKPPEFIVVQDEANKMAYKVQLVK